MTIQTEITRLTTAKADLKAAIAEKGVAVPANSTIDNYAGYVEQIKTSSSEVPLSQNWKSCSLEEFRAHGGAGIIGIYFQGKLAAVGFCPPDNTYQFYSLLISYLTGEYINFSCYGTKDVEIVDHNNNIIFMTDGDGFIADQTGTWSISASIYIGQ